MRCYTYFHRTVTKGIQVTTDEKHGPIVFLGEIGRGKVFRKIGIDNRRPANVHEGMVNRAFPREITVKEKETKVIKHRFFVLAKPFRHNHRILLRVNTSEADLKTRRSGTWCAVSPGESAQETGITVFYTAHGGTIDDRGRLNHRYCDDLIRVDPGSAILVDPLGADHEDAMVIWNKRGYAVCMSHADWEAFESEEEVDAEEAAKNAEPPVEVVVEDEQSREASPA